MHIASQSPTELVVEDSAVGLSWIFGVCAIGVMYLSITQHQVRGLIAAALFLLFALIAEVRTTFTFDATERVVRWKTMKRIRIETGSVSFDEISDIGTETVSSSAGAAKYRLAIITANGGLPMALASTANADASTPLRNQVLAFIKPGSEQETGVTASGISTDLEPSLRSLLEQDRKLDAIKLLQSTQHLGLTDAAKRIELLEQSAKAQSAKAQSLKATP
ncbi:MAG: hypothetical protein WBF42_13415 [Terracidiphilus sp.]